MNTDLTTETKNDRNGKSEAIPPIGQPASPRSVEPVKPKDGPLGMKFVPLPKATFYKGWNGMKGSAKKTEIKADFEIAVHTVTQGQWQDLMGNNPSYFSRSGQGQEMVRNIKDEDLKSFPVETVSWEAVQEFIKKLNEKEAKGDYTYRLPSDAEWEFACRGGAMSEEECSYYLYYEKPTNVPSTTKANLDTLLRRTTKVGSYPPNRLGLYDMHGNVWQWCVDQDDPRGPVRVMRGGFFGTFCKAGDRLGSAPANRGDVVGFRLVRVPVRSQ